MDPPLASSSAGHTIRTTKIDHMSPHLQTNRTGFLVLTLLLVVLSSAQATSEFRQTLQLEEVAIGNLLTWSTTNTGTTTQFVIEKSIDGKLFSSIGEVVTRRSEEDAIEYSFLDLSLGEPSAYYRLVCVAQTGSRLHTPAVYSSRQTGNLLRISGMTSTVTQSPFIVHVESVQQINMTVSLKDLTGAVIIHYPTHVTIGDNVIHLDMSTVPEGYYRFELETASERESLILQKVNPEKVLADGYGIRD